MKHLYCTLLSAWPILLFICVFASTACAQRSDLPAGADGRPAGAQLGPVSDEEPPASTFAPETDWDKHRNLSV